MRTRLVAAVLVLSLSGCATQRATGQFVGLAGVATTVGGAAVLAASCGKKPRRPDHDPCKEPGGIVAGSMIVSGLVAGLIGLLVFWDAGRKAPPAPAPSQAGEPAGHEFAVPP
ncbi:MAG TPA: hypothetical protein VHB21_05455 [Minicystis sp.]|nr:hypothetical protein [Minicystis sp.]